MKIYVEQIKMLKMFVIYLVKFLAFVVPFRAFYLANLQRSILVGFFLFILKITVYWSYKTKSKS